MATKKKQQRLPDPVRVYPVPALAERGENLAGVGIDGADVSAELAAEWLAAGLVSLEPPAASPDPKEV